MRGRQASLNQSERSITDPLKILKPFCAAGDKAGEGRAYTNIGNALDSLGQFKEALEYHKKKLEIARQTGE